MTNKEVLSILNKETKPPKRMKMLLEKWQGVYRGITIHTQGVAPRFKNLSNGGWITPVNYVDEKYQYIFDFILFSRHPREDEATRNWRYSQYRPLTKAPFTQIFEILSGAIFQDSNYQLEVPDDKDREYIWGNNFSGFDIMGYFSNKGIKNTGEDPNGLFLRIPALPSKDQRSEKVDVDIWFVNTTDIVWFSKDVLIFKREDYGYYVDDKVIFRYYYNGNESKYVLLPEDADGYYAHMFGHLPVTVAGGEWNTQGYYDSYFDKAKGLADDFIATYSAAQMVDKEASHPFIEVVPEDCPTCSGNGQVTDVCGCDNTPGCNICNGSGVVLATCGTCHGTKTQSVYPGKWRQTPKDQFKDGSIRIVNPDVGINKHHREVVKELYTQIKEALHLNRTDKALSGEAKATDLERQYQFISTVSNQMFDKIIYDTVRDIIAYRNVRSTGTGIQPYTYQFKIVKPTQFRIKTSEDLLTEFNEGTKANMPIIIRKRMASDYAEKAYNGDDVMLKKVALTNDIDTLGIYPETSWMSMRASGACSAKDMIISRMLPTWLDQLYKEKGHEAFLTMETEDVNTWLLPKIAAAEPPVINIDEEV